MRNVSKEVVCMQCKAFQRMFRLSKVTTNLMSFSFTDGLQKYILIDARNLNKKLFCSWLFKRGMLQQLFVLFTLDG